MNMQKYMIVFIRNSVAQDKKYTLKKNPEFYFSVRNLEVVNRTLKEILDGGIHVLWQSCYKHFANMRVKEKLSSVYSGFRIILLYQISEAKLVLASEGDEHLSQSIYKPF